MPKHVRFEMKDADGSTKVETEFSDEEWALLKEFAAVFDELCASPATRAVASFGSSIKWDHKTGWAPVDASAFPSTTDLAAFLHFLRPIVLKDERTHFMKVLGTISRRAPSKAWKGLRAQFEGTRLEKMMTISVTPGRTSDRGKPQALVLTSGRTLEKWLNAFRYHRDPVLAAEFREIQGDEFPTPDHVKGVMLQLLVDKLTAAAKLREIIRVFEEGPGASYQSRT